MLLRLRLWIRHSRNSETILLLLLGISRTPSNFFIWYSVWDAYNHDSNCTISLLVFVWKIWLKILICAFQWSRKLLLKLHKKVCLYSKQFFRQRKKLDIIMKSTHLIPLCIAEYIDYLEILIYSIYAESNFKLDY